MMPALWYLREMTSLPPEVLPAEQLLHQDCTEALNQGVEIYLQEDVGNISNPWVECTPLDHPWISRAAKKTDVSPCPKMCQAKPGLAMWLMPEQRVGAPAASAQTALLLQSSVQLKQLFSEHTKKKFQQLQVPNQISQQTLPLYQCGA